MSTQQPKGPWRTVPFMCNGERIGIQDASGKWVGEEGYQDVQYIPRFSPEHARRIVACVNACEGISTENLEDVTPVAKRYHAALRQRDELLEALKQAVAWIEGEPTPIDALANARALIAKAEAQ